MDKKVAYNNLMRLYDMLSEEYKQSLDVFLTDYEKSANSASISSYNEIRDGQEFYGNGYKKGYEDAKQKFERSQGEWIPMIVSSGRDSWKCSVCGRRARGKLSNLPFCHCGADMRGSKEK